MRKNYIKTLAVAFVATMGVLPAVAQPQWIHSKEPATPRTAVKADAPADPMFARNDHVWLGYAATESYIYEYDGFAANTNTRGGFAILITPEMLRPYVGGTVSGMMAGWGTADRTGKYTCFVRAKNFNGPTVARSSKEATVSYNRSSNTTGWNTITFDSTYVIPENPDTLIVGFYTDMPAGVYAVPTVYPRDVPNSCFSCQYGDTTATGQENWYDYSNLGTLCILLRITDQNGDFQSLGNIESLYYDRVVYSGENTPALAIIRNSGSKTINNVDLTFEKDGQTHNEHFNIAGGITSGNTKRVTVPIWCGSSGITKLTLSKINNKANNDTTVYDLHLLGVPTETAYEYEFHPLIEFFESENSYMSPTYYEECIQPTLEAFPDELTYASQHMDDQYMTGDDDALALSLWLADNDSASVELPCMGINRSLYTAVTTGVSLLGRNTPLHSTLYPEFGQQVLRAVLELPTFAKIDGKATIDEDGQLSVNVTGNVADGVLADGEQLYYTVYLMEDSVLSEDQMFWTKDDKEEHKGQYVHPTIIREIMTDVKGDLLGGAGEFSKTLTTEIDSEWNRANLRIVAFVNRGGDNDNFDRQVINSTSFAVSDPTGIHSVTNDRLTNGRQRVYDLSGRLVKHPASHGVYIVSGKKVVL